MKPATSRNAAGMFVVSVFAVFAGVSTEARAMLVTSSFSNHFIITTDERRSGPIHLPKEVGPSLAACWQAPHAGDEVTIQLSFKRDGSIFGEPRINYVKPINGSSSQALTDSIVKHGNPPDFLGQPWLVPGWVARFRSAMIARRLLKNQRDSHSIFTVIAAPT